MATDLSHQVCQYLDTVRYHSQMTETPVKVIANGDHMSSRGLLDNRYRISIGDSRDPRSGAGELSCRNQVCHVIHGIRGAGDSCGTRGIHGIRGGWWDAVCGLVSLMVGSQSWFVDVQCVMKGGFFAGRAIL
jgi:hypothetical protein